MRLCARSSLAIGADSSLNASRESKAKLFSLLRHVIYTLPIAAMKAAIETGVAAQRSIPDLGEYERGLRRRMKRTD